MSDQKSDKPADQVTAGAKAEFSDATLDAAQKAGLALGDFLNARKRDESRAAVTARDQKVATSVYEAEIAVEIAAANIKRFLELQNRELRSLIMRAATLGDKK